MSRVVSRAIPLNIAFVAFWPGLILSCLTGALSRENMPHAIVYFSRALAFFVFVFTLGLVAFANPVAKRQESLITDPLSGLITDIENLIGE